MSGGELGKMYKDGETIVVQGEAGECMYVVQDGCLEVTIRDGTSEFVLSRLGVGEVFGEMALFTNEPRSATVRARGAARVLTIDRRGFFARIHEDPTLVFNILQKMSERVCAADKRLSALALTDGFTELYNQRFLQQRLDEEIVRARRYGPALSCLVLVIDNQENIAHAHGEALAEAILRQVAARTFQMVRKCDIVARHGDRMLAVVMPHTDRAGTQCQIERVRKELHHTRCDGLAENETISVQIGAATFNPVSMPDSSALLRAAELTMNSSGE